MMPSWVRAPTIPGWEAPPKGPTRRLGEIMGWAVQTVDVRASAQAAHQTMQNHQIEHLPVLDRGYVEGMLCRCDVLEAPAGAPVATLMRRPVITISVGAWTHEAAALMRVRDIGALPVLYRGFLIGIVTVGDLTRVDPAVAPPRPACVACGSHHHVRAHGAAGEALCVMCRRQRGGER